VKEDKLLLFGTSDPNEILPATSPHFLGHHKREGKAGKGEKEKRER
jgi:hypothetical protein